MEKATGIETFALLQTFMGERNITINNQVFVADKFLLGDPEILDIFDFEFLAGSPKDALSNPFNLIISQKTAQKYFGDADPLGKTINWDNHDFTVTAVVKDLPEQSHFAMNFLAPISSYQTMNNDLLTKWYISAFSYYMIVPSTVKLQEIESQITRLFAQGNGIPDQKIEFNMVLEPLADIHLRSVGTRWDNAIKGDIKVVYGFLAIALLIIGIAIANYINLLTANYQHKVRENSIRKINGASELSVISLQVTESLVFLCISLIISFLLVYLLLPCINHLSGKSLILNLKSFVVGGVLLFGILILSVAYPIFFMRMFKLGQMIKNQSIILTLNKQKQHRSVRGALITFQMVIATVLISSTFIINKQLHLITKEKNGFDQENKLIVNNPYGQNMQQRYALFKEKLSAIPTIKKIGVTQNAPAGSINNYTPVWLPGLKDESKVDVGQITVDHDFITAIGAKILQGKNFDKNVLYDEQMGVVINESAVKALNLVDPIGKKLVVQNNAYTPNNEMEIIGVVEDMQYFTLREASKPILYFIRPWGYENIIVSLEKGNYRPVLQQIEQAWKEVEPALPFAYQFMDDRISNNYKAEVNTAKITTILSAIAIFLSVLGILGMILFTIQQRVKEIGIRKVNGAKISEVLIMLNRDFVRWVAIAFLLATPIAYFAMNKWLENFAYKTELSWWIFALAGLLALGIALLTVSWQSWRAATRNPVEALRYE
jgi:putative ABC transport system permease protein